MTSTAPPLSTDLVFSSQEANRWFRNDLSIENLHLLARESRSPSHAQEQLSKRHSPWFSKEIGEADQSVSSWLVLLPFLKIGARLIFLWSLQRCHKSYNLSEVLESGFANNSRVSLHLCREVSNSWAILNSILVSGSRTKPYVNETLC